MVITITPGNVGKYIELYEVQVEPEYDEDEVLIAWSAISVHSGLWQDHRTLLGAVQLVINSIKRKIHD